MYLTILNKSKMLLNKFLLYFLKLVMKLYNSLTKQKESFVPLKIGHASIYHCGPTVYDYVHIGNFRSFMMGDFIRRTLEYTGHKVTQVMNITDIGHLVSDGDYGDDKMTKALKRENKKINVKNMLAVANFYANAFKRDLEKLHIHSPHYFPKASDHIKEDIDIIESLDQKGYTYTTQDGIYFDTSKMSDYGKLGGLNLDKNNTESRLSKNNEKKNSADFALWKFDKQLGFQSPWGQGFPGWHIECSGMGMKYLGDQFDIHTGGLDLKSVHHNNEIAQSECSTGKSPFVSYWLHGAMLNFEGEKLSKSTGGNITLEILKEKGFNPLSYRYLTLQTHYRSPMNFTWEILGAAQNGLQKIYREIVSLLKKASSVGSIDTDYENIFRKKIEDDINLPQALSVFHNMMKSNLSASDKLATAYHFDTIFGIGLKSYQDPIIKITRELKDLLSKREKARINKDFKTSDYIREEIMKLGYTIIDDDNESHLEKI